jgi:hypothetical protein
VGSADIIVALIDPKGINYRARELHSYKQLLAKHAVKMRMHLLFKDDSSAATGDDQLRRLQDAHTYIEDSLLAQQSAAQRLHTIMIPDAEQDSAHVYKRVPSLQQDLDELFMAFMQRVLALEMACVDETHDNIRAVSSIKAQAGSFFWCSCSFAVCVRAIHGFSDIKRDGWHRAGCFAKRFTPHVALGSQTLSPAFQGTNGHEHVLNT